MTPLTLHPHEVRAFLAGRLGVIVRPLRFQPRDGYSFDSIHGDLALFKRPPRPDDVVALPIPHGPFWGRETFADNPCAGGSVVPRGCGHQWGSPIYKATFGAALKPVCEGFSPWRSPATMPRKYSRISGTVGDSRVCRVQDLTGEERAAWSVSPHVDQAEMVEFLGEPWSSRTNTKRQWNALYRDYDANPWVQVARIERSAK